MKRILGGLMVGVLGLVAGVSAAQVAGGATLGVSVIESKQLVIGWSARRDLLGKPVMNDNKEKIGKVEDIIVAPDKSVHAAIISTGGFVGISKHDVAIPTSQLEMRDGKIVLPGATKQALKELPAFEYAKHGKSGT